MNRSKEHEKLIDYYNGHLTSTEKEDFENHLKECPDCQEELREWEELNAELAQGLDPAEPPSGMEDRIFSNIFEDGEISETENKTSTATKQKSTPSFYKKAVWPLVALLFLSLIGNAYLLMQDEEQSLSESLLNNGETVSLAPSSETLDMNASMAMHGEGRQQTLVLAADNFTNLQEGEVYQIWLLREEEPHRAGTMVPNENGEGYVVFNLEESEEIDWDMVAITIETSPHNQAPEGDILMSAEF